MKAFSRVGIILLLSSAAGLIVGIANALMVLLQRYALGRLVWLSDDVVWMSPAAYLLLFAGAALLVVAPMLVWPRGAYERLAAFVLVTLGTFSLLLSVPKVHPLALLALAVGVGARVSGPIGTWATRRALVLMRTTLGLAVLVVLAAAGSAAGRGTERQRSSESPPDGAPNVLLIILDTVRAANLSLYGYHRPTSPGLDRLAVESVVFDRAFSPAPWTLPSHGSMFTGRHAWELSTDWQRPLDRAQPTLAETLRDRGYRTAGFVANLAYTSRASGLSRGFSHYEDFRTTFRQTMLSTALTQNRFLRSLLGSRSMAAIAKAFREFDLRPYPIFVSDRKTAAMVADKFLRWLTSEGERPFFAFLNLYDAHQPYYPPESFAQRFSTSPDPMARYDGGIAYMDREVARLLDSLSSRGVLDRTVVIVTSDHGELFEEHGLNGHGVGLYLNELHVPLLIRYPAGAPRGVRLPDPVSLSDIPATVLDLAGLPPAGMPGASLAALWHHTGAPGAASAVVASVTKGVNTGPNEPVTRGPLEAVLDSQYHYIRNAYGDQELFAYRVDSIEARSLVPSDSGRVLAGRYREVLEREHGRRGPTGSRRVP